MTVNAGRVAAAAAFATSLLACIVCGIEGELSATAAFTVSVPERTVVGEEVEVRVTYRGLVRKVRMGCDLHWIDAQGRYGGFMSSGMPYPQVQGDGDVVFRLEVVPKDALGAVYAVVYPCERDWDDRMDQKHSPRIPVVATDSSSAQQGAPLETPAAMADAADYYVSPEGGDGNPGTSAAAPLRTIARAAELVRAGSTVNILPGTYSERVILKRSGTAQARITFRRHGEGEAVWTMREPDPEQWKDKFAFVLNGQRHVVIDGITFRDCGAWLYMRDTHHVTVKDCVFDGCRIYNGIQVAQGGSYNLFLSCTFKRATDLEGWSQLGEWVSYPTPGADYIEILSGSHHNLVEDCRFGRINHVCVLIHAFGPENWPSRNIVRRCTFTDPFWKCIGIHQADHTLIEQNECTGEASSFIQLESPRTIIRQNRFLDYRRLRHGVGHRNLAAVLMMSSTSDRGGHCFSQDNRIYNNLFLNNEKVMTSYSWQAAPIAGNVFKNNIFAGNRETVFLPAPDYRTTNRNYFVNNLFHGTPAGKEFIELGAGWDRRAGDLFSIAQAQREMPELYRSNIEAEPRFKEPETGDYRPAVDSPCIEGGAALTRVLRSGKGVEVPVWDALYFSDGFGLIDGDQVVVGSNRPARISRVDYNRNVLVLERPIAYEKDDPVSLPYSGAALDIGPFEYAP